MNFNLAFGYSKRSDNCYYLLSNTSPLFKKLCLPQVIFPQALPFIISSHTVLRTPPEAN